MLNRHFVEVRDLGDTVETTVRNGEDKAVFCGRVWRDKGTWRMMHITALGGKPDPRYQNTRNRDTAVGRLIYLATHRNERPAA